MLKSKFFIIFKTLHLVLKKTYQVQKQGEKPCKMKKNYPINMKIPGARLQMVSNECTTFQTNPCTHPLDHVHRRDRRTGSN